MYKKIEQITNISVCDKLQKDNRLLPAGFDKIGAPDHIAVYGKAVANEDFVGGADQVIYNIDVAGAKGKLDILDIMVELR